MADVMDVKKEQSAGLTSDVLEKEYDADETKCQEDVSNS